MARNKFIPGLSRSDELYHFGIPGMHWGQRRFQYVDGTLTPEGRERYGRSKKSENKGSSKAKEVAKKIAKRPIQRFKEKHTWLMSDEELEAYIKRLDAEQKVSKLKTKDLSFAQRKTQEILFNVGSKLVGAMADNAGNRIRENYERGAERRKTVRSAINERTAEKIRDAIFEDDPINMVYKDYAKDFVKKYKAGSKPSVEDIDKIEKYIGKLRNIRNSKTGKKDK